MNYLKPWIESFNPLPLLAAMTASLFGHGMTSLMQMSEEQWPTRVQWWAEVTTNTPGAVCWLVGAMVVGVAFEL